MRCHELITSLDMHPCTSPPQDVEGRRRAVRGRLGARFGAGSWNLALSKGSPLAALSLMDTVSPLLRIFVITHFLPLREVGFATILTAFVAILELSTDIAIHRFIFSSPRDKFDEAVAAVHALAMARGDVLCVIGFCAAPIVAGDQIVASIEGIGEMRVAVRAS